jgi:hypothetical protein
MRVYKITLNTKGGYYVDDINSLAYDLQVENEKNKNCGYSMSEINPFINSLSRLNIGQSLTLGDFVVMCETMSEDKFDALLDSSI